LGVGQGDYRGRIDIANRCNEALFAVCERGVPMPSIIRVRPFTEEGDDPDEIAYYQPGLGDAPGEIAINAGHPAWQNLAETPRRKTYVILVNFWRRKRRAGPGGRRVG
jgi:hypothetical protein